LTSEDIGPRPESSPSLSVSAIHLSDLHVGMSPQGWMWPTVKKAFLEDLRRLLGKTGAVNLVIFSGDLTQTGATEEYEALTQILQEIWDVMRVCGSDPWLFPVPGNHDLVRPRTSAAAFKALSRWWNDGELREDFWREGDDNEYQALVEEAFAHYEAWTESLSKASIRLPDLKSGRLPGDACTCVTIGEARIGLMGLNSSWLQLGPGDLRQMLAVDTRQLHFLTDGRPDDWCAANDFNILVTHHPPGWLHPASLDAWRSEVYLPSRFDCHLHGHMHEPAFTSVIEGGAAARRYIQAASLFGLEQISTGVVRLHGYSVVQLYAASVQRRIRHWPRKALKGTDGIYKIAPDHEFNINGEGYYDLPYTLQKGGSDQTPTLDDALQPERYRASDTAQLQSLRRIFPTSKAFDEVRRVEQGIAVSALTEQRTLWVASDWGLGSDQFVGSVAQRLNLASRIYQIDFNQHFSKSDFLLGFKHQTGFSFERFCALLADEPQFILLLDDVPIHEGKDREVRRLQQDIELIVEAVLQYCDNARIVVRSRREPVSGSIKIVPLLPLDEADTRTYVSIHEHGGTTLATAHFAAQIHRHTDGIPASIDAALRDIQIVGPKELPSLNTDIAGKTAAHGSAPPGLQATLAQLQESRDPTIKRSWLLLKALAMFPRGEQLSTVKRFFATSPFYLQNARYLLDLALVDAIEIPSMHEQEVGDSGRALFVRRPVREYLYSTLSSTELKSLNRRALTLYFGEQWQVKGLKPPRSLQFNDQHCGSWQIGNANLLILRAAREAAEDPVPAKIRLALYLANSYCDMLYKGDHFRETLLLCGDMLGVLADVDQSSADLLSLRYQYARALRMNGDVEAACDILLDIHARLTPKSVRARALLNLAFCYQSLGKKEEAVATARDCQSIEPKSNNSLQASSIIVSCSAEGSQRTQELRRLERLARTRKAHVVANNIALNLADETTDATKKQEALAAIIQSAPVSGDEYNSMRASIRLAELQLKSRPLSEADLSRLIDTYHYLYGEGGGTLLDRCHNVLWADLEKKGDLNNLLRLFRHSSLIWRLRGQAEHEDKCSGKLGILLGDRTKEGWRHASRELAYFMARTAQMLALSNP